MRRQRLAEPDRDFPTEGLSLRWRHREMFLGQRQRWRHTRLPGNIHDRISRLFGPARGEFAYRLPANFRQRDPEVGGGRVSEFVPRHVAADAFAKWFFAEITFEHADKR